MYYIPRNDGRYLETVDEFSTLKEARAVLVEYRMSGPYARYYISSRACRAWREAP